MGIRMIKAKVDDKLISVELIKNNDLTVLVRLPSGKVIKRHKEKHSVDMGEHEYDKYEDTSNSSPSVGQQL